MEFRDQFNALADLITTQGHLIAAQAGTIAALDARVVVLEAAGATSYRWLLETMVGGGFTQIGEGPEDFIDMTGLSGGDNFLKCIGINAAGESVESDPVQFDGGI